jgi:hypothetical protein
LNGVWLTSPFCHIETAMAYQLGLPILVLVEQGVLRDGVLERGIAGIYVPEFDLDAPLDEYFTHPQWRQLVNQWEGYVRQVVNAKGQPPRLFTP